MTSRQLILSLVVLIGIGILVVAGKLLIARPVVNPSPSPTPSVSIAPSESPSPVISKTVTLALNEEGTLGMFSIKPIAVLQDSRCPAGVYCIQAGTVELKITIDGKDEVVSLMKPLTLNGGTIKLTEVAPLKTAATKIKDSDYRFTFEI